MEFLTQNWTEIAGVLALVIVIGERIAAVTENKTDDAIFGAVHKILVALKVRFPEPK